VKAAEEEMIAAEREVRVRESQHVAKRGSGGVFGSGGGRLGSRSGGSRHRPAPSIEKPSGLNRLATFSMFFAASPASVSPGFSPTRGRFAARRGPLLRESHGQRATHRRADTQNPDRFIVDTPSVAVVH